MLGMIDDLLAKRDVKKVEVAIAKYLRSNPPAHERGQALLQRARSRLLGARPADAIDDLIKARTVLADIFNTPDILELSGDCYFARFEMAAVGFADRADTEHRPAPRLQCCASVPCSARGRGRGCGRGQPADGRRDAIDPRSSREPDHSCCGW